MFPTDIATVLFMFGFIAFAYLLDDALVYIIAGFVVLIANLRDTSNQLETLIMAIVTLYLFYKGATLKK